MGNELEDTKKELTLEESIASISANLNTKLTREQIKKINNILEDIKKESSSKLNDFAKLLDIESLFESTQDYIAPEVTE